MSEIDNINNFRTALCLRNDLGWCGAFDTALVNAIQNGNAINWTVVINDMATEYAEHAKNRTLDKFWSKVEKVRR